MTVFNCFIPSVVLKRRLSKSYNVFIYIYFKTQQANKDVIEKTAAIDNNNTNMLNNVIIFS